MPVRRYRDSDRDQLVELWRTVFPDDPPHNEPAAMLDAKLEVDDLLFVAEGENQLDGACMAGYDGHRGWLYAVAVRSEGRRRGLGRALVEAALAALRERGCIKVNLQIRSDNAAVESFYRALGFATEERISMGRHIKIKPQEFRQ
ncbi:MAG: GNAT family acetyltransferase [Gammaproteobacteria bacterium]|nr:GNAT family acetyltransferase [Gammaproteobacteria bacterium]